MFACIVVDNMLSSQWNDQIAMSSEYIWLKKWKGNH